MRNFILIVFTLICFGITKANTEKKHESFFSQKTFTVIGMNVQKNYEATFKFFPQKTFIYGPAPKAIAFQNKLMMENKIFECAFNELKLPLWFRLRSTTKK